MVISTREIQHHCFFSHHVAEVTHSMTVKVADHNGKVMFLNNASGYGERAFAYTKTLAAPTSQYGSKNPKPVTQAEIKINALIVVGTANEMI